MIRFWSTAHLSNTAAALLLACAFLAAAGRAQAAPRVIPFAGQEWTVRSGTGGPGPNAWSDSEESVWVDGDGLHLKIRRIDGVWHCAEVVGVRPTRHGAHTFSVAEGAERLDRNMVASPFLYRDDAREVDIEFSTWGKGGGNNTQYVVQPYHRKGHMRRFTTAPADAPTVHTIDWLPGGIHFTSLREPDGGGEKTVFQEWVYEGSDIPLESDELRVHINLWLVGGMPPSDGKEAEFVVRQAVLPTVKAPENERGRTPPKEGSGRDKLRKTEDLGQPRRDPLPVSDR